MREIISIKAVYVKNFSVKQQPSSSVNEKAFPFDHNFIDTSVKGISNSDFHTVYINVRINNQNSICLIDSGNTIHYDTCIKESFAKVL